MRSMGNKYQKIGVNKKFSLFKILRIPEESYTLLYFTKKILFKNRKMQPSTAALQRWLAAGAAPTSGPTVISTEKAALIQ